MKKYKFKCDNCGFETTKLIRHITVCPRCNVKTFNKKSWVAQNNRVNLKCLSRTQTKN